MLFGFYRFEIYDFAFVFLVSLLSIIFFFPFKCFIFPGIIAKILQHNLLLVLFFLFCFSLWNWCNQQFYCSMNVISSKLTFNACCTHTYVRTWATAASGGRYFSWIFFFSLSLLYRRDSLVAATAFFIILLWYWLLAQPGNKCYETFSCLSCVSRRCPFYLCIPH